MTAIDRAMVLAAGLGTRMRPLTLTRPKPLVAVAGRTLLDHMLDRLAAAGIATAIVNVHHLADQIEAHVAGRAAPRVLVSDERAGLLDSGGGVRKALPRLGDAPFVVCNADSLWIERGEAALPALLAAWDPARMDILMLLAPLARSVGFDGAGDYDRADDGRLTRRRDRPAAAYAYAGVLVLTPALFEGTPEAFSLNRLFDAAEAKGRLHGRVLDGLWLHVGTPDAILDAETRLAAAL